MNLTTIADMKVRFGILVGFSDHSMGFIGAVTSATVIEKHICISRKIKNPDSEFSMELEKFAQMI